MGELFQSANFKKIFIAVIVITIIFISFISYLILSTSSKNTNQITKENPQPTESQSQPAPTLGVNLVPFVDPSYRIDYPVTWKTKNLSVANGGTLNQFYALDSGAESFPRIDIQATPITSSSPSVTDLINNLAVMELAQDNTTFHGISAVRLSGILPFTVNKPGTNEAKKVNKTFLFMTVNNTMYIVDYAYFVDDKESSLKMINDVLNTYDFH